MQTRRSPSFSCLLSVARQVNLTNCELLSKPVLLTILQSRSDTRRILRAELRNHRLPPLRQDDRMVKLPTVRQRQRLRRPRSSSDGGDSIDSIDIGDDHASTKSRANRHENRFTKRKSEPSLSPTSDNDHSADLNTDDPIMLCPIDVKKSFVFTRANGTSVQFDVETLIDYLLVSGDFIEPQTRIPFSDDVLSAIDIRAKECGLRKASVLDAKLKNSSTYSTAKVNRDALLAVERCAGEAICEMLFIIENVDDPDDAQMQLFTDVLPHFADLYRQMKSVDPEFSSKCLSHWLQFLKGPPNKPNLDEYGLLKVAVRLIQGCA